MSDSAPGSAGSSPDKSKRLRRPHQATKDRLLNGVHDLNQNQNAGTDSTLSADAPEFIPHYAVIPQTEHASTLSVSAPSFVPRQAAEDSQEPLYEVFQRLATIRPSHLSGAAAPGNSKEVVTDMFRDAVFHLTTNPANMEECLKPVITILKRDVTDPTVLKDIIEVLFEQCITEANFRYTGAKICIFLSSELSSHDVFKTFRGLFLNRCAQEFDKRQELLDTNVERLCGLSMFFGELFLVLEIDKNGKLEKVGILRKSISDLETTLLSRPDDVTVKCATQLLKLTGTAITETPHLGGNFDEVYNKIRSLEKHPSLNKTSHCLISSVLSRLEYNFGVGVPVSPSNPVSTPVSYATNYELNEPIFYNNVGRPITREEAGFSQEDTSDFPGLSAEEQEAYLQWEEETYAANNQWAEPVNDGYGGQWSGVPEVYQPWSSTDEQAYGYQEEAGMDDEMQAAFEAFLQESHQYPQ